MSGQLKLYNYFSYYKSKNFIRVDNLLLTIHHRIPNFTVKFPPMKPQFVCSVYLILALILLPAMMQSQWVWTGPQPITDSLADNRNAMIREIVFNGGYEHYIFWERSVDESSTAIYYRRLYEPDQAVALLEVPNVHYRNPQIVRTSFWGLDTFFYFFYESDESGNNDIYYMVYTPDGFNGPELLAGSPENETHFRCNDGGSLAWEENGRIRFAWLSFTWPGFSITEPVTVDSIGCSSPELPFADAATYPSTVAWLKENQNKKSVYYSNYNYQAGTWDEPVLLSGTDDCQSARFANWACGYGGGWGAEVITWESISKGAHTIRAADLWGWEYTGLFTQPAPFTPMISNYMIPVDGWPVTGFMTFVNAEVQNGDIFVNEDGWEIPVNLEGYINLSNSPYEETNPAFFNGRSYIAFSDLGLVWESKRNDRWQLYYSLNFLYCSGATTENNAEAHLNLEIAPNPCREYCQVSYHLAREGNVSLELVTSDGRRIVVMDHQFQSGGDHSIRLDLHKAFSGGYQGLFLIRLVANGHSIARKGLMIH